MNTIGQQNDRLVQESNESGDSPSMTQVQAIAGYAARANFDDLSVESRRQLPVHILDSLGCCIAALGAGPIEACRQQVADVGGTSPCALIGGEKANPIYAAFWHTTAAPSYRGVWDEA
jgi:2-methylcitrate dehydratase PrpD